MLLSTGQRNPFTLLQAARRRRRQVCRNTSPLSWENVPAHRSIFRVLLSNKSRAALSSALLNPSQPFSPEDARRMISPSLAVAMAFSFFTVSVEGGARSPVEGSEVFCCGFWEVERSSRRRVDVCREMVNKDSGVSK